MKIDPNKPIACEATENPKAVGPLADGKVVVYSNFDCFSLNDFNRIYGLGDWHIHHWPENGDPKCEVVKPEKAKENV